MSATVDTLAPIETRPELAPGMEMSPEELLRLPDGKHYELVDGTLVEQNMSLLSGIVAVYVSQVLGAYCKEKGLGWVAGSEVGYRCFSWKPKQVRRADVSFISLDRYSLAQVMQKGYVFIPPDLAVEVISPGDLVSELNQKLEEYLRAGVKLVWIVDPQQRSVTVHHPDGMSQRLHETDEISGEEVIPGFRCSVGTFFPPMPASESEPAPQSPVNPNP
ncbi:MAG: Uma2 family endonuclease [Isosphaeraceae bacterium]